MNWAFKWCSSTSVSLSQEELYLQRVAQLDEITTERDNFKQSFEDLRKQRLNEFMNGFNIITNKLKENYQMLTLGGDAELELVDSLDPFSEGIMFRLETRKNIPSLYQFRLFQFSLSLPSPVSVNNRQINEKLVWFSKTFKVFQLWVTPKYIFCTLSSHWLVRTLNLGKYNPCFLTL